MTTERIAGFKIGHLKTLVIKFLPQHVQNLSDTDFLSNTVSNIISFCQTPRFDVENVVGSPRPFRHVQ